VLDFVSHLNFGLKATRQTESISIKKIVTARMTYGNLTTLALSNAFFRALNLGFKALMA
jgi:hypothetical protein